MKITEIKIKDGTIIELPKDLRLSFFNKKKIEQCKAVDEAITLVGELYGKQIVEKELKNIKDINITIKL